MFEFIADRIELSSTRNPRAVKYDVKVICRAGYRAGRVMSYLLIDADVILYDGREVSRTEAARILYEGGRVNGAIKALASIN